MKQSREYGRYILALLVVIMSAGVAGAQGNAQSPLLAPTGPYSVGRAELSWVDVSRRDPENPDENRKVVVVIWYPAVAPQAGAEPAPWMPGVLGQAFWAGLVGKTPQLAKAKPYPIETIRTHSYTDVPIAAGDKKFPVLLFEPGNGSTSYEYTTLLEDVVSHGYVVVSLIPSYNTRFAVLPDGRLIVISKGDRDQFPYQFPTEADKRISDGQKEIRLTSGGIVYTTPEMAQAYQTRQVSEMAADDWVVDAGVILDQVEKLDLDTESRFHGRLDLKKIGAFGHSRGGAAGFQVAKEDTRVIAAFNLDGSSGEVNQDGGVFKPVMILEHADPGNDKINQMRAAHYVGLLRDGKPSYRVTIPNSSHGFSEDLGLMPFIPQAVKTKMGGGIDPVRAMNITKTYVEAFFDEYLEGKKSPLLDGPSSEYPELTFETNKQR